MYNNFDRKTTREMYQNDNNSRLFREPFIEGKIKGLAPRKIPGPIQALATQHD